MRQRAAPPGEPVSPEQPDQPGQAAEATTEEGEPGEEASEEVPEEAAEAAAEALGNFGLTLLSGELQSHPGENILISPFSVEQCMGMVAEGAGGKTREELEKALSGQQDFQTFAALMRGEYEEVKETVITEMGEDFMPNPVRKNAFETANSAWINADNEQGTILDPYRERIGKAYDAEIGELAFSDPESLNTINHWVEEKTEGQIPSILNSLEDAMKLILINATFFEGAWVDKFTPQPGELSFTNADGSSTDADGLYSFHEDTHTIVAGRDAFIKQYQNGFYYLGILPKEGETPEELLKELSGKALSGAQSASTKADLILTLPKYSYDYSDSLVSSLQKTGISACFTPEADFSRMTDGAVNVSDVIHKTHIELDENGTKAAAVTAAVMLSAAAPQMEREEIELIFDRPFFYCLMSRYHDMPFFMGVVNQVE